MPGDSAGVAVSDEFEIIERYFSSIGGAAAAPVLGIGDDGAVVEVADGQQLVVVMDTLVDGVHFPSDTRPRDIAYKALAVNLSDLAAMGACPAWFLLSLTLPASNAEWLADFATGLADGADEFGAALIGGDTCHGPLSISIQAAGLVAEGEFVTRHGAQAGDLILVSGELGRAALGLASLRGEVELPAEIEKSCRLALRRPRPRLELAPFLRRYASAAIDISDGLFSDLGHILDASRCGAIIDRAALPVNDWIAAQGAWSYALEAGDDYEICFTMAAERRAEIDAWNQAHPECPLCEIGEIIPSGFRLRADGRETGIDPGGGYRHFD